MWKRSILFLNKWIENLTAVMLTIMVLLIFFQVLSRELTGSSFAWTEEVARYLMFWVTLLGASVAFQHGAHIGIEYFKMKLNETFKKAFDLLAFVSGASFCLFMIVYGLNFVERSLTQTSAALNIPMGLVYLVIPISGVFMLVNLLDVTIDAFKKNDLTGIEKEGL